MMLRRGLPWLVGLVLLALLVSPFARDLYHQYRLNQELAALSDPAARQALLQRYGSMSAVGREVARRCEEIYGRGDPSCERYRLSLRE
jgi:hypothetical protein